MSVRIAITGRRGRGKDTLAQILCELVPGMERHAFADPLKDQTAVMLEFARIMYDIPTPRINREYLDANRHQFGPLWQWYGTDFCRSADEDYWTKTFERLYSKVPSLVVPDMRFLNEAEWARLNGFVLVRVCGPNRRPDADKRDDNHPSEQHVESLPVDFEFVNDAGIGPMRVWVRGVLLPACGFDPLGRC